MNRFLLYLLMLPVGLWRKMGADPLQLHAILDIKLKLDDRRPLNFGRQQGRKKKNRRFSTIWGMVVSFLTGIMYVMPLVMMEDRISGLWMFYTMFLFLLTVTLVSDFSTVLIDTRDKYIVLPQPVNDRTLFLSRALHILIYLFRIVLPMSLPGWIVTGIVAGWQSVLLFPLTVLLLLLTTLFFVMGAYLIMLRLASAEKFKEILSYFQIAFSVILFGTYYLVPRAMDAAAMRHFTIAGSTWMKYTPSYWLASLFSWVEPLNGQPMIRYVSLLAVVLPAVCLWLTVKLLAPRFVAQLSELDSLESGETKRSPQSAIPTNTRLSHRLARLLNTRKEAQAGFIMSWIQTARSRSFKMKVYPMFAYVPIYFLYLMLQSKKSLHTVWEDLPHTGRHIVLLYMCSVVMLQAFAFISISEQYKASWIYWATPLKEPGAIMAGSFKVIWVKFFFPFFALMSAFVVGIWGLPAIADVLLALVNVTLFAASMARIAYRRFPFSQMDQTATSGSKFLRAFISMAIPGALGVGHYLALHLLWLKLLFTVLSAIMLWLVWDSYAHTDWAVLKSEEN